MAGVLGQLFRPQKKAVHRPEMKAAEEPAAKGAQGRAKERAGESAEKKGRAGCGLRCSGWKNKVKALRYFLWIIDTFVSVSPLCASLASVVTVSAGYSMWSFVIFT